MYVCMVSYLVEVWYRTIPYVPYEGESFVWYILVHKKIITCDYVHT